MIDTIQTQNESNTSFDYTKSRETKTSHNERCPKCKNTIERMLKVLHGDIICNHKFRFGTCPDDFVDSPTYPELAKIFLEFVKYRGYENFVKAKNMSRVDFLVPEPGFIAEFDESQHFTIPLRI